MSTRGPDDPETWPLPTGHTNDPRTPWYDDGLHGYPEVDPEPDWEAIQQSIDEERSARALDRLDREYG